MPVPANPDTGFDAGVWVWNRDDLLRSGATTLSDLLDRIPGVTAFRLGYYGQPEAVSVMGSGPGAVEIEIDGYVVDRLSRTSLDFARIPLVNLSSVRVERRAAGLRIRLRTEEPRAAQPFSMVEAQAGEPLGLNVFRGLFEAPHFLVGPVAFGVERTASDGLEGAEAVNVFNGWAKWSWVRPSHGLQVEFRRLSAEHGGDFPYPETSTRSDLVVRGRTVLPIPGSVLEVYGGRTSVTDSVPGDSVPTDVQVRQMGARLGYESQRAWARGSLRWRSESPLPRFEAGAELRLRPLDAVTVSGEAYRRDWREAGAASSAAARVEVRPIPALTVFAEASRGRFGELLPFDTLRSRTPLVDRHGGRAGATLRLRGARLGVAGLVVDVDSVFTFGLPFDSVPTVYPGGHNQGWEISGSVPLFVPWLRAEGEYQRWLDSPLWVYLPRDQGHVGLEIHTLPLSSGNLEILARLEGVRRGAMLMPSADSTLYAPDPALTTFDAYLQIRVVTVRAFIRYEHLNDPREIFEFPDRVLPGIRLVYGVKWELWN